jgi:hypothetical protein
MQLKTQLTLLHTLAYFNKNFLLQKETRHYRVFLRFIR